MKSAPYDAQSLRYTLGSIYKQFSLCLQQAQNESSSLPPQTVVQYHFAYDKDLIQALSQDITLEKEEFIDTFYDLSDHVQFILSQMWLRHRKYENRNVQWSLKRTVGQHGHQLIFQEWNDDCTILQILNDEFHCSLNTFSEITYQVAQIPTTRYTTKLEHVRFTFDIAEFETTKSYIGSIRVNLDDSPTLSLPSQTLQGSLIAVPVRSRVVDYICCKNSILYQMLLDKNIVDSSLTYQNRYDPEPESFDVEKDKNGYYDHLCAQANIEKDWTESDNDIDDITANKGFKIVCDYDSCDDEPFSEDDCTI